MRYLDETSQRAKLIADKWVCRAPSLTDAEKELIERAYDYMEPCDNGEAMDAYIERLIREDEHRERMQERVARHVASLRALTLHGQERVTQRHLFPPETT